MPRNIIIFILLLLIFISPIAAQSYCEMDRFDHFIFSTPETEVLTDISYGEAINDLGALQDLKMDIYRPLPAVDPLEKKPAILFVHGGGLVGGDKSSEGAADLGALYSRCGFIYASIDYRIGWANGTDGCGGDTVGLNRATYRAIQDAKAAFRYLKENADLYGIDTNYMFVEGNSAGSTILLFSVYAGQEDFDPAFLTELGSIDSSGNTFYNHTFDAKAYIGEAAGFPRPHMLEEKYIPSLYFHGTCDSIVPYFSGPIFYCYQPFINPIYYGSWEQVEVFRNNNRPYQFYTGEGAGHDVVIPDTLIQYARPFLKEVLCDAPTTKEFYRITSKKRCAVEPNGELFISELYPNPVADQLYLTLTSTRERAVEIYIYNAQGQMVGGGELDFAPPERSYSFDLHLLPKGIYFMRVSQRQEVYFAKFVK